MYEYIVFIWTKRVRKQKLNTSVVLQHRTFFLVNDLDIATWTVLSIPLLFDPLRIQITCDWDFLAGEINTKRILYGYIPASWALSCSAFIRKHTGTPTHNSTGLYPLCVFVRFKVHCKLSFFPIEYSFIHFKVNMFVTHEDKDSAIYRSTDRPITSTMCLLFRFLIVSFPLDHPWLQRTIFYSFVREIHRRNHFRSLYFLQWLYLCHILSE